LDSRYNFCNSDAAERMDRTNAETNNQTKLKRSLGLPLITLYGLGTTIGGGIYVLIGHVAGRAGMHAPLSFVVAALMTAFTAFTFAELSSRYPQSAGEAVYVEKGLGIKNLALLVGLLVVFNGVISSAALANGFVGYFQIFLPLPDWIAILCIALALGLVAAWGIGESVAVAAIVTIVEIGGLVLIVIVGGDALADLPDRMDDLTPGFSGAIWAGILSGSFLAFYAFIGFEDMVNVAEEVKNVRRVLPIAIIITLVVTTFIYFVVALVAVLAVPPAELGRSDAPLALIFERKTGSSPALISLISILAVLNGALIQVIMASRVLYGLSKQKWLPSAFGRVHPRTRTPVNATFWIVALVAFLALVFNIEILAQSTSLIILIIAALVNASLIRLKRRDRTEGAAEEKRSADDGVRYPIWVPVAGMVVSAFFAVLVLADLTGL